MTETFQCGDPGALVAYLYDECEPGERDLIAAHIERCANCASEIDTLGATRRSLAAWRPPDVELGFQITRTPDAAPAKVLTSAAWWRAPLPGWAQAAAALLIFAAGLSVGLTRNDAAESGAPREAGVIPISSIAPAPAPAVTRDDLAQVEQRLKTELSQMRTASTAPPSARASEDALMTQVRALIEQGNEDQRRDFTRRMVELASGFETQRRVDLATVRQSVGQLQGAVGTELRQQREVNERVNSLLVNVSERSR